MTNKVSPIEIVVNVMLVVYHEYRRDLYHFSWINLKGIRKGLTLRAPCEDEVMRTEEIVCRDAQRSIKYHFIKDSLQDLIDEKYRLIPDHINQFSMETVRQIDLILSNIKINIIKVEK